MHFTIFTQDSYMDNTNKYWETFSEKIKELGMFHSSKPGSAFTQQS